MAKNNYYAVKIGRCIGIYTSWEDCKEQVTGYKGAIYKGFVEKKDAEEFMKDLDCFDEENKGNNLEGHIKEPLNEVSAYVDGSFLEGNRFGCGCVIIKNEEIIAEISKAYEDKELASMRNVAGEIKAAELAMLYALDNGYDLINIYHDYQGIASWCIGEWKANKVGTKAYKEFYDGVKDKLKVRFIKVKGHSGNKYNDMADLLAKRAIEIV